MSLSRKTPPNIGIQPWSHDFMLPAEIKMMTQLPYTDMLSLSLRLCVLCVNDTKVIWCHPVSVAIIMAQQNGSVKCCGYICCCWWGARAAVVKTEEAEQKQTGTAFPTCTPPGNAVSLIPRTGFVHFWPHRE